MLCVLSSFPPSEHETQLQVDFGAPPPHGFALHLRVFAAILPAHLFLEAAAQDARNLIPALMTSCSVGLLVNCYSVAFT
jgi:hypothetical protein